MRTATTARGWLVTATLALGLVSCVGAEENTGELPRAIPAEDTSGQSDAGAERHAEDRGDPSGEETTRTAQEVDRILKKAEKKGKTVEWLQADFVYHYHERLIDAHEWRNGRLVYKRPSFIYFEFTDEGKETFKFDGRIYVENRPRQRQRYVHVFRKPDQPPISVLDVEQLPFPHPFGQDRKKLLENFRIEHKGAEELKPWPAPESETKGQEATPEDRQGDATPCEHLILRPKPGSRAARRQVRVDYWLDPETGMLKQVRSEDKSERILTVRFQDIRINDEVDADEKLFRKGPLPKKWEEEVEDHTEQSD